MIQDSKNKALSARGSAATLLAVMIVLSGCTPEKAAALRTAAQAFRSNAAQAVQSFVDMSNAEIAAPQRSPAARTGEFVKDILSVPNDQALTSDIVAMAADPYSAQISDAEKSAEKDAIAAIQKQYDAFAAIFDDLERGSFVAHDKVAKTKKYAVALTAGMANLADEIAKHPPRFIQRRAALVAEMDTVKKDGTLTADQKRQRLDELLSSWDTVVSQESAMQAQVVEKCAAAAASGQTVLQMIDSYDKLSIEDLSRLSDSVISAGEQLSGRDLSTVRKRNDQVVAFLNANPEYQALLQSGINAMTDKTAKPHN